MFVLLLFLFLFSQVCLTFVTFMQAQKKAKTKKNVKKIKYESQEELSRESFINFQCISNSSKENNIVKNYLKVFSTTFQTYYRKSRPDVFLGKGALKVCSKFAREHSCQSVISIPRTQQYVNSFQRALSRLLLSPFAYASKLNLQPNINFKD